MGKTNVSPDARLPLRLLTPSEYIFHTANRKYFARKNTSLKLEQMCFKIAAKAVPRVLFICNNELIQGFSDDCSTKTFVHNTLLQMFTVLHYFGELITISMR